MSNNTKQAEEKAAVGFEEIPVCDLEKDDRRCNICFEDINDESEVPLKMVGCCRAIFGDKCLRKWARSLLREGPVTCPMCRHKFPHEVIARLLDVGGVEEKVARLECLQSWAQDDAMLIPGMEAVIQREERSAMERGQRLSYGPVSFTLSPNDPLHSNNLREVDNGESDDQYRERQSLLVHVRECGRMWEGQPPMSRMDFHLNVHSVGVGDGEAPLIQNGEQVTISVLSGSISVILR